MAEPAIAIDDMSKQGEKLQPIASIPHDVLASIPPTGNMVDGARIFNAERTSHEAEVYAFACTIARPDPIS
jgi:hypothetical protein